MEVFIYLHITICKDDVLEYDECGTVESILRSVLLLSLLLAQSGVWSEADRSHVSTHRRGHCSRPGARPGHQ